jgi:hypothetical protein
MMTPILTVLGLSGAMTLLLILFVRHTRVRFVIELEESAAHVQRGDPPSAFVRACSDVARLHRIASGRILGVRTGSGIALQFSGDIPRRAHQAFRNVWIPPDSGGPGGGNRAAG